MEPLQRVTAPTLDVLAILLAAHTPDAATPDPAAGEPGAPEGIFGLEIMKRSGRPSGTIYPILERLERQGWIASTWEEHTTTQLHRRRVYSFTPEGADAARALVPTPTK